VTPPLVQVVVEFLVGDPAEQGKLAAVGDRANDEVMLR
jgi:hypothetical protein